MAPSFGPEAQALLDEVRASIATLTGLLVYESDLGHDASAAIRRAVEEVEQRLARRELRVAIVGEPGSGKSTLLDALMGERLLGLTTTEPSIVITVRRADERAYRATLKDGSFEDFATRVPDATRKLAAQLASAESAAAEAKHRSDGATLELVAAADAVEIAEGKLGAAFTEFELSRDEASRLGGDLDRREKEHAELVERVTASEAALPFVLRKRPAWWAVWWWVAWVVVLLFALRAYRAYRRLSRERDEAEDELAAGRVATSGAAERCKQAEADLASANVPVEEARKALAATRRIRNGADARREELEREAERRRADLATAREERHRRFAAEVRTLTDPSARGRDVAQLDIAFPARLLPEDVVIIDPAGANSEDADLRDRAWSIIRDQADGCIVVSELEHAVSSKAQKFLEQLKEVVVHAILVLTKMDDSLRWAQKQGVSDPWEEVDRARKIGTRRFAREIGRDPSAVLSLAVAAEEALREGEGSEPARRKFEEDIELSFRLLRQERALILGARSAGIVRRSIGGAADAQAHAERSYQARIASLEAQRIPGPERFHAEQMSAAEHEVLARAAAVVAASKKTLADHAGLARVECAQLVEACKTKEELGAVAPRLSEAIARGLAVARDAARTELDAQAELALRQLESKVIGALRERYQLLHEVDPRASSPEVASSLGGPIPAAELRPAVEHAVRTFDRLRVGYGVGGLALGATAGTLVFPGIGTAAGALAGGFLTFARTLGTLKRATIRAADAAIADLERPIAVQIDATLPAAADAIRAGLGRAIEHAVARFGRWIAEPIEAEREAIERERDSLKTLEELRTRLEQHDARLAWLIETASGASVGLYA